LPGRTVGQVSGVVCAVPVGSVAKARRRGANKPNPRNLRSLVCAQLVELNRGQLCRFTPPAKSVPDSACFLAMAARAHRYSGPHQALPAAAEEVAAVAAVAAAEAVLAVAAC